MNPNHTSSYLICYYFIYKHRLLRERTLIKAGSRTEGLNYYQKLGYCAEAKGLIRFEDRYEMLEICRGSYDLAVTSTRRGTGNRSTTLDIAKREFPNRAVRPLPRANSLPLSPLLKEEFKAGY